jgi:DNA-directed RNA polymerase specialized sigma24 family protein
VRMPALNPDYSKRDFLLPPGCKDLIDVLQLGKNAKDWWQNFFDTYWRLIYDTARKAGLTDGESQEVVQEVIIGAAQQTPQLEYDPAKGSFKAWVMQLVRWRIIDKRRKKGDNAA